MDNQFDFVPPPIPKKSFLNKKWIWITLGLVIIITITVGIIIALNGESTSEDSVDDADNNGRRYIKSEDQLRDGEIAMYDSDGRMYAVEIDEDYYSGNGIVSSNDSHSNSTESDSKNSVQNSIENSNNSKSQKPISASEESYSSGSSNYYSSNNETYSEESSTTNKFKKGNIRIGDTIDFIGSDEWIILDVKDDSALIISKYSRGVVYDGATWENSSLRKYLNETLYNSFSLWEKERILSTNLINSDNPNYGTLGGNDTQDKIFILSPEEIETYKELVIKATGDSNRNPSKYFVRMPGQYEYSMVTYIVHSGSLYIDYAGDSGLYVCTKPAMWIKLDE